MKKRITPRSRAGGKDELRDEYRFDYRKAKPNRFANQADERRIAVVLDPDVSKVFRTADSVNAVLRALVKTMPPHAQRATGSKPAIQQER